MGSTLPPANIGRALLSIRFGSRFGNRLSLLGLVAAAIILGVPRPAAAATIHVDFTAVVSGFDDHSGFFGRAGVVAGDVVSGSFYYSVGDAPIWSYLDMRAQYLAYDFRLSIGSGKVAFDSSHGTITVDDNLHGYNSDFFGFSAGGHLRNPSNGETVYFPGGAMWVRDRTQTTLASAALPDLATLQRLADSTANPGYDSFFRINGFSAYDLFARDLTLSARSGAPVSIPDHGSTATLLFGSLLFAFLPSLRVRAFRASAFLRLRGFVIRALAFAAAVLPARVHAAEVVSSYGDPYGSSAVFYSEADDAFPSLHLTVLNPGSGPIYEGGLGLLNLAVSLPGNDGNDYFLSSNVTLATTTTHGVINLDAVNRTVPHGVTNANLTVATQFLQSGWYEVFASGTLRIRDREGVFTSDIDTLYFDNSLHTLRDGTQNFRAIPPTVWFEVQNVLPTLNFDLSASTIYEGQGVSAHWRATDPGLLDDLAFHLNGNFIGTVAGGGGLERQYSYGMWFDDDGVFNFTGTARDDVHYGNAIHRQLTVLNVAPTITALPESIEALAGEQFRFFAQAIDPGVHDVLSYHWDFNGDGLADYTGASGYFSLPEVGAFDGILRVLDGDGGATQSSFRVSVSSRAVPEGGAVLPLFTTLLVGLALVSSTRFRTHSLG